MQDNRNTSSSFSCDGRGTVCIDTNRVLDGCRDRDCFEDVRVYLTDFGEQTVASATNIRARNAKLICAYVGVDEVPFNRGFYKVTVRYFIEIEFEACLGIGRSQTVCGLAIAEKEVILYGGEGRVLSFESGNGTSFCGGLDGCIASTNDPKAIVEAVEPIILNTKIVDSCTCGCGCGCECCEIPECVRACLGGEIVTGGENQRLVVSFGIFSVIRIVRPVQLLVQATDYTVPDKECVSAGGEDNPCALFRTIAFPVSEFRGVSCDQDTSDRVGGNGCGCKGRNN